MESKKHKTIEDYPPFDGEVNPLTYFDLQFSDNQRIFRFFRQIVKDGIDLKLVLHIDENLPSFKVDIPFKSEKPKIIYLLPTVENFILHYLHTGSNTGIPSYPQNWESITFRAEDDYLYRHLKRELLRNKYIYKKESENGIDGCNIISEYPYGTIDYGFIPHTLEELKNILEEVEPQTEAVQIAGRFRKGIDKLIHITNTNPSIKYQNREELEQFLNEQHNGYIKLVDLHKQAKDSGEKHIIIQAIRRTDYEQNGYVTNKGKVNYFRYNNAYLDERLKSLYRYPARLYKAYKESGAFNVFSESMYSAYTEEDRKNLRDTNTKKAERINILYEIYNRLTKSEDYFDLEFLNEIKNDFSLFIEAFVTIGYKRVKQLQFKDSDIRQEIKDFKFVRQLKNEKVIEDVYKVFKENTRYTTREIKDKLQKVFERNNLELHRNAKGEDITFYFDATVNNTSANRGWNLGTKLFHLV